MVWLLGGLLLGLGLLQRLGVQVVVLRLGVLGLQALILFGLHGFLAAGLRRLLWLGKLGEVQEGDVDGCWRHRSLTVDEALPVPLGVPLVVDSAATRFDGRREVVLLPAAAHGRVFIVELLGSWGVLNTVPQLSTEVV